MKNFIFVVFAMIVMMGCGSEINGNDVYDVTVNDVVAEDTLEQDDLVKDVSESDEGTIDFIVNDVDVQIDTEIVDNDTEDAIGQDVIDDVVITDLPADAEITDNLDATDVFETVDDAIDDVADSSADTEITDNLDATEDVSSEIIADDVVSDNVCVPDCYNKECGDDGCGGTCECEAATNNIAKTCLSGTCECARLKVYDADGMEKDYFYTCNNDGKIECVDENGTPIQNSGNGGCWFFNTCIEEPNTCENNTCSSNSNYSEIVTFHQMGGFNIQLVILEDCRVQNTF